VLVVDDEADVRKPIRLTLTTAGYEVVEAEDGEHAIAILDSDDYPFKVNTILCDIRMPRVSGAEAISYFRMRYPFVPVVVLTGYPDEDLSVYLLKQGVQDVLVKPVSRDRLLSSIARSMDHPELFRDPFAV
jgi:DNA-binding NtrC family response regulator